MADPRDRTNEFLREVRRRQPYSFPHNSLVDVTPDISDEGEKLPALKPTKKSNAFVRQVKLFNQQLSTTSVKLESLANLVKCSRSFHNYHHADVAHLTMQVNDDVALLKMRFTKLGTSLSNKDGDRGHYRNVINQLRVKHNRAVNTFQNIIKQSQENLALQQSRGEKYSSAKKRQVRPRFRQLDDLNDEKAPLIERGGEMILAQMQVNRQDSYQKERAETVQTIEKAIVELATMYEQVANMVVEQGATAERLEATVGQAMENVDMGVGELQRYLSSLSSNRWLIIKVFAIIIFFMLVFALLA